MAIATDSYYDVVYNDETVDRIGLSKYLSEYTIDEIATMSYCGTEFSLVKNISEREQGVNLLGWDLAKPFTVDDGGTIGNGGKYILNAGNSDYQFPNGMPFNVVWLAFDYSYAPPQHLDNHDGMANHCKIITEFDAPKYVFEMQPPVQRGGIGATSWDTANAPLYDTGLYLNDNNGNILKYQISNNEFTDALNPCGGCVAPYMFTTLNGYTILVLLCSYNNQWYTRGNGTGSPWVPDGEWTGGGSYINYNWETSFGSSCNVAELYKNSFNGELLEFPYTWYYSEGYGAEDWGLPLDCFGYNDLGEPIEVYFRGEPYDGVGNQRGFTLRTYCKNRDQIYKLIAGGGIKFKTDKIYKPIIEGGWVTGYTDDMTKESELDGWHGSTVHAVTPTPPAPIAGDNENEEVEMPLAYIGGTGGFVQFIKINSAGLASADDISAALSRFEITTIGKDLLRNFVSYKCFAVIKIDPNDTVTRQIKVDGHALTDENGNPLNGQVIGSVLPIDFTIGTPSRYFNDFRDFAPYTKLEAYVPFCGWFTLPSWCIGRKIHGTMFTDLYNGTVKAVIYASDTVVAEIGGCCAYDIPFVADATGAKAGAVISSALSTAAATAATVSLPNVSTGIAAATSAANTICAVNSNVTTLKGVLGDGSNLNGLLHCYLKITRPQSPTRNNVIPGTYKHEIGMPTYKEIKLASGDGYTQVNDANISGAMTAREKQMIIDGFRHGLIL